MQAARKGVYSYSTVVEFRSAELHFPFSNRFSAQSVEEVNMKKEAALQYAW